MTKIKNVEKDTMIIPAIAPMNYQALEWLSWFMTDSQNICNWAGNIFRGGMSNDDQRLIDLIAAANKSISEIEDDVAKLKEFLAAYVPSNSN
jgi:hypothetical protein